MRPLSLLALGAMLLVFVLLGTSCSTKTTVIDTSCTSFQKILVSRDDVLTRFTEEQIASHNRIWENHCEGLNPVAKK